ncbi:hypothetical protein ACIO3O_27800 [Streptomyces sp. NPDC087440]|uniref:hypothetical protein n=1 Tax=Streptomyces sp. NPDC087440 TaxID=3365790 RepID=UPI00381E2245
MPLAAGKFIDYTGVLWQDIILNIATIAAMVGLVLRIAWWWRERKLGVRGAAERNEDPKRHMSGHKVRTRRIWAAASVAGTVLLLAFGGVLMLRGNEDGGTAVLFGGIFALAWLVAAPVCRTRPRSEA